MAEAYNMLTTASIADVLVARITAHAGTIERFRAVIQALAEGKLVVSEPEVTDEAV
ncbi:MAG: hypothetical protein ACRDL7_15920 [Gaiellaceae bacterium]